MIGICVPSIILGPILILIFGIWLEILPVSGWGEFSGDKILPTITLGRLMQLFLLGLQEAEC